ncbi:hypothetical protein [Arthrobacter castelli]|uniref:hypothetical protein n=1 Tax=Arthrobacter castelli TaxID=271431 RepID=UPI000421C67B|nr:hypothetical protein [Arthrobacter castelli]
MTTTAEISTAEALTALAYEQRTANLLHYLDPLPVGHNEGPAVLELIRERLGIGSAGAIMNVHRGPYVGTGVDGAGRSAQIEDQEDTGG